MATRRQAGEHALDVGAGGPDRERLGADGDLGLERAAGEPVGGRQDEREREAVDAAERHLEDGAAVADALPCTSPR